MAKSKTERNSSKNNKAKQTEEKKTGFFGRVRNFFRINESAADSNNPDGMPKAEITRFCVGAIIFLISAFVFLSILSHPFTVISFIDTLLSFNSLYL